MKMKRTAVWMIAVCLTAVTVLSGCQGNTASLSDSSLSDKSSVSGDEPTSAARSTDPFDPSVKVEILAKMKEEADAHDGIVSLKVWCASPDYQFEKSVCKKFREEYLKDADFHIEIKVKNAIGEFDAGGQIIEKKTEGADVFHFLDSQIPMLADADAISPVPELLQDAVRTANSPDSLGAVSLNDTLYCYPKSCDSGYILFYDKRILKQEDVGDLDTMIAKSREQGKNVFINLGDAMYGTSFFLAAGVDIAYQNGVQTASLDTPEGLMAARAMCHLAENHWKGIIGSPDTFGGGSLVEQGFRDGLISAAVIGTWEEKFLKEVLEPENLGAAKLPTALMDGEQKQLHSFGGYKTVGVNAYSQCPFSAHVLSWYLTNEQSQIDRYRARNNLPTNRNALEAGMTTDDDTLKIKDDVAFKAFADQQPFSHAMNETVSSAYWGLGIGTLGNDIVKAEGQMDDETLQKRLKQMQDQLAKPSA